MQKKIRCFASKAGIGSNFLMNKLGKFCLFLLCLTLFSCGYRFGQGELSSLYRSISVPYVQGDIDGRFTAALIKAISVSGEFVYKEQGDLTLEVEIIDFRDENIGFRYDKNREGRLTKSIIPTETRLTVIALVRLKETFSGKLVLGPAHLSASVDFDHDYYSSRKGVNVFSLGQLTDFDAARDAVYRPLNSLLAKKIVDYINAS